MRTRNCFTRFLNWIREFSFVPYYTTRFYIEEYAGGNFQGYSDAKFLETFGGEFGKFHEHPDAAGSFGPPFRIMAQEASIRALLAQQR